MEKEEQRPGNFFRIPLEDGTFGYARMIEFPVLAFYDLRTSDPKADVTDIVSHPIAFYVMVHESLAERWQAIGYRPLESSLQDRPSRFWQDPFDPSNCLIIDGKGNERQATIDDCVGLEPEAVWEPEHIEDRLLDHFKGRPNRWLEALTVRRHR